MFLTPIFGSVGVWAVAILAAVSLMGLSFIKGMAYEGDRRLVIEAQRDADRQTIIKVVEREVQVIRTIYVTKKQKLEADRDIAITEVIDHAKTLPDPVECWLAPERMLTIGKAWGVGLAPNPAKRSDAVQGSTPAEERKPQ